MKDGYRMHRIIYYFESKGNKTVLAIVKEIVIKIVKFVQFIKIYLSKQKF